MRIKDSYGNADELSQNNTLQAGNRHGKHRVISALPPRTYVGACTGGAHACLCDSWIFQEKYNGIDGFLVYQNLPLITNELPHEKDAYISLRQIERDARK